MMKLVIILIFVLFAKNSFSFDISDREKVSLLSCFDLKKVQKTNKIKLSKDLNNNKINLMKIFHETFKKKCIKTEYGKPIVVFDAMLFKYEKY